MLNTFSEMNLIKILEKIVSPVKSELEAAQNYLKQAEESNITEFLKFLSDVLQNPNNTTVARMAAGLHLKNMLTSKDSEIRQQYQQRWLAFPDDVRIHVKEKVLSTLGTEVVRPSSAAQCVAYIAIAELPQGKWPELIQILTRNVTNPESSEMMKEANLVAIGYICQDIDPYIIVHRANDLLTAIVHGMRKDETSDNVKHAATLALLNSLEFTRAIFERENERHFIMQVVCETTQSQNTQVRVASLQCLVKIMSLYYQHMEYYMKAALFAITVEAMKSDVEEIALQGIEFWSNVCDEEVDLSIEASDAAELGLSPSRTSRFYAKGALPHLVTLLMEKLTKQEEHDDKDDWNPCKGASVCLMLMASCCQDDIVPQVLPYVKAYIKHPDWRNRDAAIMAFGSILEGPDPTHLKPVAEQAMPTLIELMDDPSVVVRDTIAWTIGRVCEFIPEAGISTAYLPKLIEALIKGLSSEARVAANICWAFNSLAQAAYDSDDVNGENTYPETSCLSQYFEHIVTKLLDTTERADGNQANLRSAAYEALMELVKNSPRDCYVWIQNTTMIILERLQRVLSLEVQVQSNPDRTQYYDLQSMLCATLQSVLRKMTSEDAPKVSDSIMSALLQTFTSSSGGVQEDALMAVSALAAVLGENFLKYMDAFRPFLAMGIKNHTDYQVCSAAVGLTGDICRALEAKVFPYCDEIMTLLLENLGNSTVNRLVKPQVLSVIGDIALAIGTRFTKYLNIALQTLLQACQVQVDKADYDMVDYLNELRDGCLEAYTGIIQGLKGERDAPPNQEVQLLQPHIPHMIQYITVIAQDQDRSDSNVTACVGLIGDLCSAFGANILPLVDTGPITELLNQSRRSKIPKTKTMATWAAKEIKKIKKASSTS